MDSNQKPFSELYWNQRYQSGSNSGAGSYGRLAQYKARIINEFIGKNGIKTVIEFGAGDGNQLSLYKIKQYLGFDVSEFIVNRLRNVFAADQSKSFLLASDYNNHTAELSMSIDVVYHLVEDEVFDLYMTRLFQASEKYVIIYSSNYKDQEGASARHVKHRLFTDWIDNNCPQWKLINKIDNLYPYNGTDPVNTSVADFYFYQKN